LLYGFLNFSTVMALPSSCNRIVLAQFNILCASIFQVSPAVTWRTSSRFSPIKKKDKKDKDGLVKEFVCTCWTYTNNGNGPLMKYKLVGGGGHTRQKKRKRKKKKTLIFIVDREESLSVSAADSVRQSWIVAGRIRIFGGDFGH
jgi:hypothetical protein